MNPPFGRKDVSGGERRMPAEINLVERREPPKVPACRIRANERRLRKIIFGRNVLHRVIGQPVIKNQHGRWIAAKNVVGKRVHLVHGE
jgi:hypothetical protein